MLQKPTTPSVSIQLQSKDLGLKRGLRMWKLNAALLEDVTYVTALKMIIPIDLSGKADRLRFKVGPYKNANKRFHASMF